MLATPPCEWWRYVPCAVCNSRRGETCRKGGWSWPEPTRRPHSARYRLGLEVAGLLWLLDNGFTSDVLGSALDVSTT